MKFLNLIFAIVLVLVRLSILVVSTKITRTKIITPSAIHIAINDIDVRNNENVNWKQHRLIENSQHRKTDACDNFLHYACGDWLYFLDSDIKDTLHVLDAKLNRELNEVFENRDPAAHELNFMKQIFAYYDSCNGINREKPPNPIKYLDWLSHNEGLRWALFRGKIENAAPLDWVEMLAIFRKYGLNNLIIHEQTIQHPFNNSKMIIGLKKPFAESDYHVLGPLLDENRMFTLWNVSDVLDHRKFVEFDVEFKEVVDYHLGGAVPQLITVQQLKELQLEWLERYLTIILNPATLDPYMEIYIQDVEYMKIIKRFLDEIDQEFLAQYIQLNFLSKATNRFSDPGYDDCTQSTRVLFPLVMQWLHKRLHPEVSYEFYKIHLFFANLKHYLKSIWIGEMENSTIVVADYFFEKLDSLKLHIMDVWQPSLEHLYREVWLNRKDYIGNRLRMYNEDFRATHSYLWGKNVVRGALEFLHRNIRDNADSSLPFLLPRQNLVVLPVTLLQFPLYHPQYNDTFIYSSLGFLLAREIENYFDNSNVNVDANGDLSEEFVVTPSEENPLHQELVAANALQLVYKAFMELHPVAGDEAKLFLLNFAQMYCSNYQQFGDYMKIVNSAVKSFTLIWNVFGCDMETMGPSGK